MLVVGRPLRLASSVLVSLALAGCGTGTAIKQTILGSGGPQLGTSIDVTGFLGGVAADEPEAVQIGKQILAHNGSAADAAAAVGFALAVTLPSRAGLGAGGACLAFSPTAKTPDGEPEAIMFTSRSPAVAAGDRPAAVPMLARGLFALQARYGVLPIEQIIAPAERLARLGAPVSKSLAADLAVVGGALIANPAAAQVFGSQGAVLGESDIITQPDLSAVFARLRTLGVRDMYEGELARILVAETPAAGGPLTPADLADATPRLAAPLTLDADKDRVSFLPAPADGGIAAAAAFQRLQIDPKDLDAAQARALGVASAWRHGGQVATILGSADTQPNTLGALPASTSFVTLDRTGNAVACAVSMGNLFGTGRVVPGTGLLLGASPAAVPPPLLAAAIAWNQGRHAFRAEVAGSGQEGAPLGVAAGMLNTLKAKTAMPSTVPSPGRINAIACPKYLPGDPDQCTWATDPRNAGLAVGSTD
jgi:gamma-glutamyltranspeptidase/glutathione hydrolase